MYNEIYHYGVKGMKWGIRKKYDTISTMFKRKNVDDDVEEHADYAKAHSKKSVKEMSDAELREINNRLNMEQQYARLTEQKSKIASGLAFVGKVAATGTTIATLLENPTKIAEKADKLLKLVGAK